MGIGEKREGGGGEEKWCPKAQQNTLLLMTLSIFWHSNFCTLFFCSDLLWSGAVSHKMLNILYSIIPREILVLFNDTNGNTIVQLKRLISINRSLFQRPFCPNYLEQWNIKQVDCKQHNMCLTSERCTF